MAVHSIFLFGRDGGRLNDEPLPFFSAARLPPARDSLGLDFSEAAHPTHFSGRAAQRPRTLPLPFSGNLFERVIPCDRGQLDAKEVSTRDSPVQRFVA